mgnify:CR=1 FL=1
MTQPVFQTIRDDNGEVWRVPDIAKATGPNSPQPLRIWDCIDQSWTSPLVKIRVYDQYLPKRVVKCSACAYTTVFFADSLKANLAGHIDQVRKQAQEHENAEATQPVPNDRGVPAQLCTGCGFPFSVGQAAGHIMQARVMGASHQRVEALLMNRFALEPSEPTIFHREMVVEGDQPEVTEPEAPPRSGRRRKRNRRGSRSN